MNIDRPLDEIVQESRNAKRAARADRRKQERQARVPNVNAAKGKKASAQASPSNQGNEPKLGASKKRIGIAKKRRARRASAAAAAAAVVVSKDRRSPDRAPATTNVHQRLSSGARNVRRVAKGVKVAVSNLDAGVTQPDIAELFETVGPLRSATLRLLPSGQSACEAEVVFEEMKDALDAIKKYNMVPLDNEPLHITLATDSIGTQGGPVHSRVGKPRGRALGNGRKKQGDAADVEYIEDNVSPRRGNGYSQGRNSPTDDRENGNGPHTQGRRQNRRRYRRYQNKPANGNGHASNGDRDHYMD